MYKKEIDKEEIEKVNNIKTKINELNKYLLEKNKSYIYVLRNISI